MTDIERVAPSVSSRSTILDAVRSARVAPVEHPDVTRVWPAAAGDGATLRARFVAAARAAGADVVEDMSRAAVAALAGRTVGADAAVVSVARDLRGTMEMPSDPHALAAVALFVCEASFGVAENGALWFAGASLGQRAGLFLATHVLALVPQEMLVADMHAAYSRLDLRAETFGVFVAGPSKTADIEQSLVIGAHGPKAFTIAMLRD